MGSQEQAGLEAHRQSDRSRTHDQQAFPRGDPAALQVAQGFLEGDELCGRRGGEIRGNHLHPGMIGARQGIDPVSFRGRPVRDQAVFGEAPPEAVESGGLRPHPQHAVSGLKVSHPGSCRHHGARAFMT